VRYSDVDMDRQKVIEPPPPPEPPPEGGTELLECAINRVDPQEQDAETIRERNSFWIVFIHPAMLMGGECAYVLGF